MRLPTHLWKVTSNGRVRYQTFSRADARERKRNLRAAGKPAKILVQTIDYSDPEYDRKS